MATFDKHGWLIVGATFFIGFIVNGNQFSFGLLLIEMLDTFNQGRASTAIIGSIISGVMYLIAPVAGLLSEKYGCRIVVITGSLISALGFFISTFMDKLFYLYLTYGLLGGLGFGLMFLPANVCLMQHFERNRAVAEAIAMCGSGAGIFAINQLTGLLFGRYGWRGAMMVQAGIVLNGVVCGLFIVPVPTRRKGPVHKPHQDILKSDGIGLTRFHCKRCGTSLQPIGNTQQCTGSYNLGLAVTDSDDILSKKHDLDLSNQPRVKVNIDNDKEIVFNGMSEANEDIQPTTVHDYCKDLDVACAKKDKMRTNKILTDGKDTDQTTAEDSVEIEPAHGVRKVHNNTLCDFSLLKNPKFLMMLISVLFSAMAFTIPFNFIPDLAVEKGMTKQQGYWLASSIGITNIVSRLLIGWISDRKFVNRLVLLECLLVAVGIATLLSVVLESFAAKMIYTCAYGFLFGGYVLLVYVVIADLFGVDVLARSLGFLLFTAGTASLLSSPIAGWIYDQTGSYDTSFILAGSELLISACILPVPFLIGKYNNRRLYKLNSPSPLAES